MKTSIRSSASISSVALGVCLACTTPRSGADSAARSGADGSSPSYEAAERGGDGPPILVARQNCGLEAPAFCETFDEPHPGGRGGDLDERRLAFARWDGGYGRTRASSFDFRDGIRVQRWSNPDGPPSLCGQTFADVLPPGDVRVCDGQLNELFNDRGGLRLNSFMIRAPFDFTDRTGNIAFDVDAKRNAGWDGHGWWLEVWITEDPAPIPYHGAPTVGSTPRNGVGFQIAPHGDAFDDLKLNSVGSKVVVARDYKIVREDVIQDEPPTIRVKDREPNRFRVRLSKSTLEIWGSDHDKPDELRWLARADDLGLNFSVGYVHFQHVHYNAAKTPNCDCDPNELHAKPDGYFASSTQVYRWDNLGFDGPALPALRAYDAPENTEDRTFDEEGIRFATTYYQYDLRPGLRLEVANVDPAGAKTATLNFSYKTWPGNRLRYRFNGKAWHELKVPDFQDDGVLLRAFSVPAPISELIAGNNVVEFMDTESGNAVGNLDISIHPRQ